MISQEGGPQKAGKGQNLGTHPSPKVPLQVCVLPRWFGHGGALGWSWHGHAPAGFISFPEICVLAEGVPPGHTELFNL